MTAFVLVADDIADNRQMYAEYLEYEGYRVEQARNGEEAVALARALMPDLIVMDLSMPEMDGWEATRLLKGDPVTRSIPIVVVSGHAFGPPEIRAREAGADAFLTKPCLPAQLAEKISAMLAHPPMEKPEAKGRTLRNASIGIMCSTDVSRDVILAAIELCDGTPIVLDQRGAREGGGKTVNAAVIIDIGNPSCIEALDTAAAARVPVVACAFGDAPDFTNSLMELRTVDFLVNPDADTLCRVLTSAIGEQ